MEIRGRKLDGMSGHDAGRRLLEEMYRAHTGSVMPPILTQPKGKPYFAKGGLHFSITHTKSYVFCALSEKPIGIDAEELDRRVDLRLADRVLSPGEKQQYCNAPDKKRALLTFWVLKEAAAKCTGEGLQGFPNHTDFSLDDPRVTEEQGCLLAVIEEE